MKKMLVLTLALSVMAVGSAFASDLSASDVRGPKRVNINIVVPKSKADHCCDVCHAPHDKPHHKVECCHSHKHHGFKHSHHKRHNHSGKNFHPGDRRPSRPAHHNGAPGRGRGEGRGSNRR